MRLPDSYDGIRAAYDAAQPGDTLLLYTGIYSINQAFTLTKLGFPGKPIRFRGGSDGAIIERPVLPILEMSEVSRSGRPRSTRALYRLTEI